MNSDSDRKVEDSAQLALAMAHDLRNPLTALANLTYLLEHHFEPKHIELMKKQIILCEAILSNFLEFVAGRSPGRESINIRELLEELCAVFFFSSKISFDLAGSSVFVFADGTQVRQIFLNLLQNAVEAMGEKEGRVVIAISAYPQFARIDISDEGEGIPESSLDSIFDPAFTTKKKGFGLGLPATRHMVRLNNGRIEVSSVPGEGTTFSVYLPLC